MSDFIFTIRILAISAVVVVLMQIRVAGQSVEAHAETWIRTAAPVLILREVAEGGLLVVHDAWSSVMSNINSKYSKKFEKENMPGEREAGFAIKRSQAFVDEQKKRSEAADAKLKARAQSVREALGMESETTESE